MTTKLKYSDLPPFRWYPVEAVEIENTGSYFAAISSECKDGVRWSMDWVQWTEGGEGDEAYQHFSYLDYGPCPDVRFVMRLETPEQQAIRVIESPPGTPPEEWHTTPAYHAPQSNWNDITSLGDWPERLTELGKHQSWIIEVADGALKRIEDCTEEEIRAFVESEKARMR